MTLGEAVNTINKDRAGRLADHWYQAYTCGPQTYKELLAAAGFDSPRLPSEVQFMGILLFPSNQREGRLFPSLVIDGVKG